MVVFVVLHIGLVSLLLAKRLAEKRISEN